MNEHVRKLSEQATTYTKTANGEIGEMIFDKDKFAMLIVEDCIKIMQRQPAGATIANQIKKHFGVIDPLLPMD